MRGRGRGFAGTLTCLGLLLLPSAALGNTITVTSFLDDNNGSVAGCSLREAVKAANGTAMADCAAAGADDVIELPGGTHNLTIGGANESAANTGDLDILDSVTIRPVTGSGPVTIEANEIDRVFELLGGTLTIEEMVITGGLSGSGSGISIPLGLARTATVVDSTLRDNTANANGGGGAAYVSSGSTLNLLRSKLVGNTNTNGRGGALLVESGTVNATDTAFLRNSATGGGGAVAGSGFSGSQTYSNVLFFRNEGFGGALNYDGAKNITITGSTIIRNHSLGDGGGIVSINGDNDVTIGATVIAGNTAAAIGNDCRMLGNGNQSSGHNVTGDASDCAAMTTGPGDRSGTTTAPLAAKVKRARNNGGPVPTAELKKGSPAINRVPSASMNCLATDARGVPRKGKCDSGSYERVLCGGRAVNAVGTPAADVFVGSARPDVFLGFGGADIFRGKGGRDSACGGPGDDRLFGGKDPDKLIGGPGNDLLDGGPATDTCKAGPGGATKRSCER